MCNLPGSSFYLAIGELVRISATMLSLLITSMLSLLITSMLSLLITSMLSLGRAPEARGEARAGGRPRYTCPTDAR